ncbi:MAG: hypothetical protein U5N85_00405 [Arcicella sp.]|nr:hypothetical protein [Arcicella sp.]
MISDKQVLLEKIEIKEGSTSTLNTNLYVSYRSGNTQKFWANLAIATVGVAVSTQLQSTPSAEGNSLKSVSPLIPLGVSVATLPSIWKNRPRGIPQAGLWLQHRDTRGRLTNTWEQPLSSEAKNSSELLSINIDKPLSAGTVEVYLQNGGRNPVYYWGYETAKMLVKSKGIIVETPPLVFGLGCPDGYLPNGNGRCCNPFTGDCIDEPTGGDGNPTPPPPPPPIPQGCPDGYLPNGQGMCCSPFTGQCVSENGGGTPPPTPTPPLPTPQGCPTGYLPNGNGMCCRPGTNDCVSEGGLPTTTPVQQGCPSGYLPNGQGLCCSPFTSICINDGDILPTFLSVSNNTDLAYLTAQSSNWRDIDEYHPIVGCGSGNGYVITVIATGRKVLICLPPNRPLDPPVFPGDNGGIGSGGGSSGGSGGSGGGGGSGGSGGSGSGPWFPNLGGGGGGTPLPPHNPINPAPVNPNPVVPIIDDGTTFFELSISDQIKYPKFTELVKDLYRYVQRNRKIMDALILWSGYSEQQIKEKIKFKEGPMIVIKELNGPIGYFNHQENPDVINIDISVRGLEQAYLTSTREATAFLLAVTVLHELVHQGRYANDLDRHTWEYGYGFEESAFGMIIDRDNAGKYSYRLYKK